MYVVSSMDCLASGDTDDHPLCAQSTSIPAQFTYALDPDVSDQDWYSFDMDAGYVYQIDVVSTMDTALWLFGPGNGESGDTGAFIEDDDDDGDGLNPRIIYTPSQSGRYYLRVAHYLNAVGKHISVDYDLSIVSLGGVDVEEDGILPSEVQLSAAYPNPFNPSTSIQYALPGLGQVRISVFDLMGREVAVLVDRIMPAGEHIVAFYAAGLTSGTYLIRLETEGIRLTRKMTLLK